MSVQKRTTKVEKRLASQDDTLELTESSEFLADFLVTSKKKTTGFKTNLLVLTLQCANEFKKIYVLQQGLSD